MKKSRALLIGTVMTGAIVVTTGLAIGAGHGFGGPGCGGRGEMHSMMGGMGDAGGRLMKMAEHLDLSAAQRDAIWKIFDDNRDSFRDYGEKLMVGRKAMREAVRSDSYDRAAVQTLAQAQGEAMGQMMALRADLMHQARQVLTPEQRDQLAEMRGRHRQRRGEY